MCYTGLPGNTLRPRDPVAMTSDITSRIAHDQQSFAPLPSKDLTLNPCVECQAQLAAAERFS